MNFADTVTSLRPSEITYVRHLNNSEIILVDDFLNNFVDKTLRIQGHLCRVGIKFLIRAGMLSLAPGLAECVQNKQVRPVPCALSTPKQTKPTFLSLTHW